MISIIVMLFLSSNVHADQAVYDANGNYIGQMKTAKELKREAYLKDLEEAAKQMGQGLGHIDNEDHHKRKCTSQTDVMGQTTTSCQDE